MTDTLPLFPLQTVLFPGNRITLRLFESRYIDMVRECLRSETGFGVVCQLAAPDGSPSGHARIGTEALIRDFSTLDDGLLGIEASGERRFTVQATRARDNGLLMADVDWLTEPRATSIDPRHGALQALMREAMNNQQLASTLDIDPDESASLGFGLASVLPLPLTDAQRLLEMSDSAERLDRLLQLVELLADSGDDET